MYSKIIGTGSYLPTRRVSNVDLVQQLAEKNIETSDEWIVSRSGIRARHYADANVQTSDMATIAAQRALTAAGVDADQIDLIIVATSTPDFLGGFPSTACVVQQKLKIKNRCAAFDVQAVCSGFVYGLATADMYIRSGLYQRVLVIGAEIFSRILNFEDRTTCVLFGDGAGAVVVSASESPGILAHKLRADGNQAGVLCMSGRVANGDIVGQAYLSMDGPAVFKLAVTVLEEIADETLKSAGMTAAQIDWFIPHQANIRIMHGMAKKLQLPLEKMVVTLDEQGNTSAASIPLALDQAVRDGRVQPGQHVLMEGVGGGFTWGAVLVKM